MRSQAGRSIILATFFLMTASGVFAQAAQPAAAKPAVRRAAVRKPAVAAKPAAVMPLPTSTPTEIVAAPAPAATVATAATQDEYRIHTTADVCEAFATRKLWMKIGGGGGVIQQKKLEDLTVSYKKFAVAKGLKLDTEVSQAAVVGEFEVGYLVNTKWGASLSAEAVLPGSFKATLASASVTTTQEIGQILLPVCLNVNAYMPDADRRFYFSAGGGALFSMMTYKQSATGEVSRSNRLTGVGSCVRLGLGHQWAMGAHGALDAGLRGFWGAVSRFNSTYTDDTGAHDAVMAEDPDGLVRISPKSEVGTDGLGYLKMGYMEMDARLCVTYHY